MIEWLSDKWFGFWLKVFWKTSHGVWKDPSW